MIIASRLVPVFCIFLWWLSINSFITGMFPIIKISIYSYSLIFTFLINKMFYMLVWILCCYQVIVLVCNVLVCFLHRLSVNVSLYNAYLSNLCIYKNYMNTLWCSFSQLKYLIKLIQKIESMQSFWRWFNRLFLRVDLDYPDMICTIIIL